jgi:hypothetical protein
MLFPLPLIPLPSVSLILTLLILTLSVLTLIDIKSHVTPRQSRARGKPQNGCERRKEK